MCLNAPLIVVADHSSFQAFWASLLDDLNLDEEPCYTRVLVVLHEIKGGFMRASKGMHPDVIDWHSDLDLDSVEHMMDFGEFDLRQGKRLLQAFASILLRILDPLRRVEMGEKWGVIMTRMDAAAGGGDWHEVFCNALEFLLGGVRLLHIDACNSRFGLIKQRRFGVLFSVCNVCMSFSGCAWPPFFCGSLELSMRSDTFGLDHAAMIIIMVLYHQRSIRVKSLC